MAKAAIVLYKSKTYSNGHPVMLRITHKRKPKYYTIEQEFVCAEKQWNSDDKEFAKSFGRNAKRANLILQNIKTQAQRIIMELEDSDKGFSFELFEKTMFNEEPELMLLSYFDEIIKNLKEIDKVKNAEIYNTTKNVLSKFLKGKDTLMRDFDYKRLKEFERFLQKRSNKDTTIHQRMRTLRALYNRAKDEDGLETYPFKKYRFGDLNIETRKRAISAENLKKIFAYRAENNKEEDTLMIFKFMFYARGINFGDLVRLKKENVRDGMLTYKRAKTKQVIVVKLLPQMYEILNYFEPDNKSDRYLFPILHEDIHKTEQQKVDRIKKTLKANNKQIQTIASVVGVEISEEITTNSFRHSWATLAKHLNIPIAVISEALGHTDEQTTKIYLASFEEETISNANEQVANFLGDIDEDGQ